MRKGIPEFTISALFLIVVFCSSSYSASNTIKINTGWSPPVSTVLGEIMQAVFDRAEISLSFNQLPGERSIAFVAQGVDDGDCCRIPKAIAKDYPELVRVPEVVYEAKFSAFAKLPHPKIESFESLKPYSVGTIAGWKVLVNNLKRIQPEILHVMDDPAAMFNILAKDRIDIATFGYLSGLQIIINQGLSQVSAIEPPLVTAPLYLYLNEKHAHLVPQLDKAIKELKSEGKIDRIVQKFLP